MQEYIVKKTARVLADSEEDAMLTVRSEEAVSTVHSQVLDVSVTVSTDMLSQGV